MKRPRFSRAARIATRYVTLLVPPFIDSVSRRGTNVDLGEGMNHLVTSSCAGWGV